MSFDWGELRSEACDHFGDTPGPALEERILRVFAEHPALVVTALDSVTRGWNAGRIRSPWPMLATQVEREAERAQAAHAVVASGAADHDALVARAERYVRQVGYLHQSEQELRDELASRKWPVVDELVELWRSVRPLGEQVEREQLERAERWRKAQAAMHDLGKERTSQAHHAQPVHSSQNSTALTAVSARSTSDADADIEW